MLSPSFDVRYQIISSRSLPTMVSTGMRPASSTPVTGTQRNGGSTAVDDGASRMIPRPTPTVFRRLVSGLHQNLIDAMGITSEAFENFKKVLRDRAQTVLDCQRFLYEQNPDTWAQYLDWAREELGPMMSKYEDAWPIELYIEHYLSKKTYSRRHKFRQQMMRSQCVSKTTRVKSPPPDSEHDAELLTSAGPPPPDEEQDVEYPTAKAHSGTKIVKTFLQTVNPNLGHLATAFEESGIMSDVDLMVVRSWPPAVRKDFFEREFVGKISALQIQALNVRFGEI